jgi:hypothetical protein
MICCLYRHVKNVPCSYCHRQQIIMPLTAAVQLLSARSSVALAAAPPRGEMQQAWVDIVVLLLPPLLAW